MRKIKLTKGLFALVDDEDYEYLSSVPWYASKRRLHYDARSKLGKMHRVILGCKRGEDVDHINQNPLDNRRKNLRIVNRSVNCMNRSGWGRSGSKGVYFREGRWEVNIWDDGRLVHIGCYESKLVAEKRYAEERKEEDSRRRKKYLSSTQSENAKKEKEFRPGNQGSISLSRIILSGGCF